MTTDWRALCFELTEALCGYEVTDQDVALIDRTRAALAEPEPEGPTNTEIHALADELLDGDSASRVDFARAVLARWGTPNLTETRSSLKDVWAAHQPAIEAAAKAGMDACRADEPAVPDGREPASVIEEPSEVAELVAALRNDAINCTCSTLTSGDLRRAADLLEQRQATPAPVSTTEPQP